MSEDGWEDGPPPEPRYHATAGEWQEGPPPLPFHTHVGGPGGPDIRLEQPAVGFYRKWLPTAVATGAGLALPLSWPGILGTAAIGAGARAADSMIGNDPRGAAEAAFDPEALAWDVALPGALKTAGAFVGGLREGRLNPLAGRLPGGKAALDEALSLRGALRDPEPLPFAQRHVEMDEYGPAGSDTPTTLPMDANRTQAFAPRGETFDEMAARVGSEYGPLNQNRAALSEWQNLKTDKVGARRVLEASGNPAAVAGAGRLRELGAYKREVLAKGEAVIDDAFKGLSDVERTAVTDLLDGDLAQASLTLGGVSTIPANIVAAKDKIRAGLYEPIADLKSRFVRTLDDDGKTVPFRPIAQDYSPDVRLDPSKRPQTIGDLYLTNTTEHRRMGRIPRAERLLDAREVAQVHLRQAADLVSTSRALGPARVGSKVKGSAWGPDAVEIYNEMQRTDAPFEAAVWKEEMDSIFSHDLSEAARAESSLLGKMHGLMLGGSWLTNFSQAATPAWRYGLDKMARGAGRYLTDPALSEIAHGSGALKPGFAHLIAGDTLGKRALTGVEHFLRGPANAGAFGDIEELARNVRMARATGARPNAAIRERLARYALPETWEGKLTAEDYRDLYQRSADIAQFHAQVPGETGSSFRHGWGRAVAGFNPFGFKAAEAAGRDILGPIGRGAKAALKEGDLSLLGLGLGRLASAVPATMAAQSLVSGGRIPFAGKVPDSPESFAADVATGGASTLGGLPLEVAVRAGLSLAGVGQPYDPSQTATPPLASLVGQEGTDLYRGARDVLQGKMPYSLANPAFDALALKFPHLSVARPLERNLIRALRESR